MVQRHAALLFVAAALAYIVGAMGLTLAVNLRLNGGLAAGVIPVDTQKACQIWQAFSRPWQVYNQIRTMDSDAALHQELM